jgi:PAS domain S-box-containing protein
MSSDRRPTGASAIPSEEIAARLAAIVESSDDAIVSKDLNGVITSWNPAAERMYGYPADEAIGRSIRLIIPEERYGEEDEVLRRIVRGERVDHFETVRRRKDRREIHVSLTVSPVRGASGAVVGASKIARDITARKRDSLRAAFLADMGTILAATLDYEATLRDIARLITTGGGIRPFADYAIADIEETAGTLRRVTAAHRSSDKERVLEAALRYAPDPGTSLLARPLRNGQPLLVQEITPAAIESFSRDPEHTRIMLALAPRSLITIPLTARGHTFGLFTVVRSESPEPFDDDDLAFASEVGRRTALAVDNARLYAESQRAVAARDQVLAVVSHDLRNALGVIATSARLLLAPAGDEQRTRRAETIVRACVRMNRLMQDLLDVSRLQAGHGLSVDASPQDASALLREACDHFRGPAEQKLIVLDCEVPAHLPAVLADHDRVLQVLSNLLSNAVKFTPDGGSILVRAQPHDDAVLFSVCDSGPGVRAHDLTRIFDRFWQASNTASLGTGLGLPIAKGIVEAHRGRIWADSKPGIGASFHFTLPVAENEHRSPSPASGAA